MNDDPTAKSDPAALQRKLAAAMLSRRRFLIGAGALGLGAMAGCGGQQTTENTPVPTNVATTATPAAAATVTALSTVVARTEQVPGFPPFAPVPHMLEVVEDRVETVLVKHIYGEVEIPKNPQRVYTDASALSAGLLLDLNIVASDIYEEFEQLPNFEELVEGIDVTTSAGNLERIASFNPDLIITNVIVYYADDPERIYDLLSQIAPTIVFNDDTFTYWQQAAVDLAEALDLEPELKATFAQFEAEVDEACAPLRERIGNETVVRIDSTAEGQFSVRGIGYMNPGGTMFLPAADSRWLYDYCGLQPPADFAELVPAESGLTRVSEELLPEVITADHIFAIYHGNSGKEVFVDNPLWQTIPAVQNGNVYYMPPVSAFSYNLALNSIRLATEAVEEANASE